MENDVNASLLQIQELSNKALKRSEFAKKYGALIVFAILIIFNLIVTPGFVDSSTVWNLIIHTTTTLVVAMGMTFVIATAGIDISVGSTMALTAVVTATLLPMLGMAVSIIIGLALGAGIGLLIGTLTVKFKIQPMVLTLALMIALRSIARMVSNAKTVNIADEGFIGLSVNYIGGTVPVQLIYVAVIAIVFYIIATRTVFGKSVEAIGNNPSAARLSGIKADKNTIMVYVLLGILSALAGCLAIARTMNCNPSSVGSGMEMDAIAAVVIGGTSMMGGKPRILGTVIGCFIITLITTTVNMNGIPSEWSMVFKAAIIILAVYIQSEKKIKVRQSKIKPIASKEV